MFTGVDVLEVQPELNPGKQAVYGDEISQGQVEGEE